MRKIFVVGIGAGHPDQVTVQAVSALKAADVLFVADKRADAEDLVRLREAICERHLAEEPYRLVPIPDPERDRAAPAYRAAVERWRRERAERWEQAIGEALGKDGCGAFLVWGDPALYDSTIAVLDQIAAGGRLRFEYEVIPGISSVQALAAGHRIPLNRVGGEVHITTGRRLREDGLPEGVADVVVMLDAECSFKALAGAQFDIYWGAYVGTEDEILINGDLNEVVHLIERARADARKRKGWVMDTYLLRRREERPG